MWKDIAGELCRISSHRGNHFTTSQSGKLSIKFEYTPGSLTRGRLICADNYALDARQIMQGLERHHHLNRRAVGIGHDAFGNRLERGGIDFRYYQGDLRIHTPGAGVIDDD